MTRASFRVIDTGRRRGRENIAFDQAMIDAHQAGEIPDTIRFIHFHPVALVGRHQALSQEVRLDYCAANGIDVGRRLTGGGAIYMDQGQLGWALVCKRQSLGGGALGDITRLICESVAAGLSKLGVDARFRPRNDIEVDGRKISGTGGFFDGDTLIFQGTVLGEVDPAVMFSALNVPQEKLSKRELVAARSRVTTLRELTGAPPDWEAVKSAMVDGFAERLNIIAQWGEVTEGEERRANEIFAEEIGTDEFVYEIDDPAREPGVKTGFRQSAGGAIKAHLRVEGPGNDRVREVLLTGDFFATPPRMILDLESSLRGVPVADVPDRVTAFFKGADIGLLSVGPDDFSAAICEAAAS
ncbi:MAG: lipoate--protein ligase family protein [Parvularculaceae bacterium]|nr:lipoate--protein ligase family protein [Parvularculaceae bacterium]